MGYWGFYLFESDHDHDVRCMLEKDIGGHPLLNFGSEAQEQKAKALLDSGLYEKLIVKYTAQKSKDFMDVPGTKIILLTACAMAVGAKIDDATKALVRKHVDDPKEENFHWEAKQQMRYALQTYKSGTKLGFHETALKVAETDEAKAKEKARDAEGEPVTAGGFVMMNVAPPPGQDLFGMGRILAEMKKRSLPKKSSKNEKKADGPMKEVDPNIGSTFDMLQMMAKTHAEADSSANASKKKSKTKGKAKAAAKENYTEADMAMDVDKVEHQPKQE